MLRLVLLAFYLVTSHSSGLANIGGGWDPIGLSAQSGDLHGGLEPNGAQAPEDIHGGLDPDGAQTPPTGDPGGGLDPNG